MASSGTMVTSYRNNARFYINWSVGDQDIGNNRSLIHWTAGLQAAPGQTSYWYNNAVRINSLYFSGHGNLASGTWSNIFLNNGASTPLRSGSFWINHNTDGTKDLNGSFSGWLFSYGDLATSAGWSLPTIPRNSQVSTDKASYTLGDPIKIITNRLSSSYTHYIIIKQNNASGTVIKTFNSVGASVTWTPTPTEITTMQQMIPNSNTLTIHIEQINMQAGTESTTTKNLNLADANPLFSNFTFRDIDTGVTAITGDNQVLVKGKSTLETRIGFDDRMVAIKEATEDKYSISFDGATQQEPYSGVGNVNSTLTPESVGERTIQVSATDSRNNSTLVSKPVTVYDYEEPTIESSLTREDSFGNDTTVSLAGDWSPLTIGGVDKNQLTVGSLSYRYKEDGGAFGAWDTKPFSVDGSRWSMDSDFIVSLDNTKKYIFEFEITDEFGTVTTTDTVSVGIPIMFIGENNGIPSIGIGKLPEDGALDVLGDIYSNGGHVAPAGVVQDFAGTTAPTGWLECDGTAVSRITYAGLFSAIGTTWGAGDGSTTFNLPDLQRKTTIGAGGTGTSEVGSSVGDGGGRETTRHVVYQPPQNSSKYQDAGSNYLNGQIGFMEDWLTGDGSSSSITEYSNIEPDGGSVRTNGTNNTENRHGRYTSSNIQPSVVMMKIIKV